MSFPTPDPVFNPNVEVKEEDDRQFNEDGQLISGGVRSVTYVDGVEYNPKRLAEIAAEQEAAEQPEPPVDPFVVTEEDITQQDQPVADQQEPDPGEAHDEAPSDTPIGDEVAQEQPTSEQ
jgi:hypothetical protein